jgi:uncharacterized protein YndB with AHSA1/START domain
MSEVVAIAPVTKSIRVTCSAEDAFGVFTSGLATWWPLDTHALHPGEVREVVWEAHEGGEVYEVSSDGARGHWATVRTWEPPSRLVIDWHVGREAAAPTEVEVRFTPVAGGTQVDLEHRGWERLGASAADLRAAYDGGWELVLGPYLAHLS